MNNKIYSFLQKNSPAGKNTENLRIIIIIGYIFCSLSSFLIFIYKFSCALANLYYYDEAGKKFINEKGYYALLDFESIIENCFAFFPLFFVILLIMAVENYRYHFQGAKSIYTMLRVGRKELAKRCLLIPALTVLLSLISMAVIYLICTAIYILFLPEIHL